MRDESQRLVSKMMTRLPSQGYSPKDDDALFFGNLIKKVNEFPSPLLTTDDVVELFGYSKKTVYDWRFNPAKYNIPSGMIRRVGNRLKFNKETLLKWHIERSK